jgi:hypothetical protein
VASHNIPFKKGVRSTTDRDNILHASVAVGAARKFPFLYQKRHQSQVETRKESITYIFGKIFLKSNCCENEI